METTQDGFLNNAIQVLQPAKGAHRAGLDAILLAASIPKDAKGVLADFGSGAGVAGFAALHMAPDLTAILLERDETMADLATRSLVLNRGFAGRAQVLKVDLTLRGDERRAAGLTDNRFDWIIVNPPYNPVETHQSSSKRLRKSAHAMEENLLAQWVETARLTLRHKGALRFILRPENLADILAALRGFGHIRVLPIAPRAGENAHRIIVAAQKDQRNPLQILPPLVLHEADGTFTPQTEAIMRGKNRAALIPAA
ncbi:MAG: methyltransferase [Pseudomonadota bacterium]